MERGQGGGWALQVIGEGAGGCFLGEVVGAGGPRAGLFFPARHLISVLQEPWLRSTDSVSSCPAPKHAPGLMREGLARGRSMPAQIAKTGVFPRGARGRRGRQLETRGRTRRDGDRWRSAQPW